MSKVCLDTNILVTAYRPKDNEENRTLSLRANELIDGLFEQSVDIVVPSIVLAEFLYGTPTHFQETVAKRFSNSFIIAPFDHSSAIHFGEMMAGKKKVKEVTKAEMKADYMIIAIARSIGCTEIYTEDNNFIKFADGIIDTPKIPALKPKQQPLEI